MSDVSPAAFSTSNPPERALVSLAHSATTDSVISPAALVTGNGQLAGSFRQFLFPEQSTRWLGLFACLLLALLYLGTSSGPAIFDLTEGQYAGAVREMLDQGYAQDTAGQLWRGHWLVPTNDGIPRLQKPPLVYWLEAVSMQVFGVNEFGARLPNALACLLWAFAVYLLGRRLGGPRLGIYAALILGTMAGAFIFGHMIMPEPFLAAFLTLTFWCFASACHAPQRAERWMTLAWFLMALGSFCKGLHGAGYPLAVAALLAWRHPASRPVWRALARPAGPLLFLLITAPWYVAMEARFPGFLRDQFFNEQLGHVFNQRFPRDSERVSLLVFWVQHLVFFLPWTFFLPAAGIAWWRARTAPRTTAGLGNATESAAQELPTAWALVTAVSILFSALQDYYTMTAWGAVALWLARPWVEAKSSATARNPRTPAAMLPRWTLIYPAWALVLLGIFAAVAAVWLNWWVNAPATAAALAASRTIAERDSILVTISTFPVGCWRQLLPPLWITSGAFALGGVSALILVLRGRRHLLIPTVATAMSVVLVMAVWGMGVMEDQLSLKRIAQAVNLRAKPGVTVVCQGNARDNPSAFFYLNYATYWVGSSVANEFATRELKIGDALFLDYDQFAQRWSEATRAGKQIFLICEEKEMPRWHKSLALSPAQAKPIERSGSRVLIGNL